MEEPENTIEIIARAFIVVDGKILLCKAKDKHNYFFPGGHVEFGEKVQEALKREMMEEIGAEMTDIRFWGISENAYEIKDEAHQEINVVFEGKVEEKEYRALESHMEYDWFPVADVFKMNVLPENLKEEFLKWTNDREFFYTWQ